jgi:hypothetical protein
MQIYPVFKSQPIINLYNEIVMIFRKSFQDRKKKYNNKDPFIPFHFKKIKIYFLKNIFNLCFFIFIYYPGLDRSMAGLEYVFSKLKVYRPGIMIIF